MYQNPEEMFIKDSIRGDIAYAMEVRKVPEWERRTAELLERFRLAELRDRDGRLMSGGQMRRASLAIGIALNPGILLLDEPTANLDIATRREILAVLERHEGRGPDRRHRHPRHAAGVPVGGADHCAVRRAVWWRTAPRDEIFARADVVERVGIRPPEIFSMAQALDRRALCYTVEEFLSSFQEAVTAVEKLTAKLSESILDKFSMDFLRNQVLKNAYGNDDTVIAALDPRVLLAWYLFFGLVPWFVSDIPFLLGCFLLVMATTLLARVAGLVLFLFALGVFSQTGYLFVVTLLFGGDASAIAPLLILTLKVATISLASVTVFSGLDPDKLSNGLMWYGCPERLSFSISYAYRMLPMLMEEFQNVLLSYRLRGNPPAHETFGGKVKYLIYQVKIIMQSFYPLMLNTAKRSRTTVEALELRGYRYAAVNKSVKKIKLAALKVTCNDGTVPGHLPAGGGGGGPDLHTAVSKKEGFSLAPGFSHPREAGQKAPVFHRLHRLALRRGQSGRPGRPVPDGALQHPPVRRCVRLHRLGEPQNRGRPGAGKRPENFPRHGDRCGGGRPHPVRRAPGGHSGAEPAAGAPQGEGHFLPFARLMDLFEEYPVVVGCGHPFRAGGHVPELPQEQLRRLRFLDLNGKDLALDRDRTERLTYALGKKLEHPCGVRQRHPSGGAVRLRHHGL